MTGDLNTRLSKLSKEQRSDLLARLRTSGEAADTSLTPRPRTRLMMPSFQQEQMWFVDRLADGKARNNSNQGLRMRGPLDLPALRAALAAIVSRHEILRTTLVEEEGQVWQVIHPQAEIELAVEDLTGLGQAERADRLDDVRRRHLTQGFDLESGPLARGLLVRLEPDDHLLLWSAHHIIWDPGSRQVFFSELSELYSARLESRAARLTELPVQYADFAAWQRERVNGERGAELSAFWANRLSGLSGLEVAPDRPRPREQRFNGTRIYRRVGGGVMAALRELGKTHHTTVFMTLAAALDALLVRLTGETDVSVATASMMRRRDELRPLLGCFVNMVVLRVDASSDPTFAELLARVRDTVLEAFSHEELPFEKVVEAAKPWRDASRNPLFQIEFTASAGSEIAHAPMAGLATEVIPVPDEVSRFDMSVLANGDEELNIGIEYNTDLYEAGTIERLLERLELLVRDAVARPGARISELAIASAAELAELTGPWSHGPVAAPAADETLDGLFAQLARATPGRPAVVCDGRTVTYGQLADQAGQLACRLRDMGVGPERLAVVRASRSASAVAALLGVLAAGGAYVPVDPAVPAGRLSQILADAGAVALVTDLPGPDGWPAERTLPLDAHPLPQRPPPEPAAKPGNLAYVIYTSGSTGQPKGVMVEHRSVVNFTRSIVAAYRITAADRIVQFASLAFDVSVFDIFAALLSGATLVVATEEERRDPWRLTSLLRDQCVTVAELPPALLPALDPMAFPDLRLLSLGGEAFPTALANQWLRSGRQVINGYGPTETTVAVTLMDCAGSRAASPPIGRPMAGHQALVLTGEGTPAPVGVPGELCIAGPGLARGYLGQPADTVRQFVPNPYSRTPGERMYRTGDLVRWLGDRNLEFLGRVDRQVKVRGFRVEPQEVESALLGHPAVRAVTVEPHRRGDLYELIAYVEIDDRPGDEPAVALRDYLTARLPAYLVPAQVIVLERIPRTATGKVDRHALPAPDEHRGASAGSATPPRDDLERRLAQEIFAELLGVDFVGVDEDFFELGGNSLHATRLLAKVASVFGVRVGLADFFTNPSVAGVAELVRRHAGREQPGNGLTNLLDEIERLGDDEAADLLGLLGGIS